jgi:hypothetical protein
MERLSDLLSRNGGINDENDKSHGIVDPVALKWNRRCAEHARPKERAPGGKHGEATGTAAPVATTATERIPVAFRE